MNSVIRSIAVIGASDPARRMGVECAKAGVAAVVVEMDGTGPVPRLDHLDGSLLAVEALNVPGAPVAGTDVHAVSELVRVIFAALPDAIVAITSPVPSVTAVASGSDRPARCGGLHFVDVGGRDGLVEVVRGLRTDGETVEALTAFVHGLGKEAVTARDRPGHLADRLLLPYLNDVVQAYDDGLATAEDIDLALELGLGYPLGPLALLDRIGLARHLEVTTALHIETGDNRYTAPALLRRMVEAGFIGDEIGRGFRAEGEDGT